MENVVAAGAVVVVVALIYWLGSLKDKALSSAVGAVNRRVQSGKHNEGLDYARKTYFYVIQATDEQVIEALVSRVKAEARSKTIGLPVTYRERVEESRVTWGHGTSVTTLFRAHAAVATSTDPDGAQRRGVILQFTDVATRDGIVAEIGAMRALKHDLLSALRSIDGTVDETVLEWS